MANFKGGFAFNNEAAKVEVEQAPDGTLISCVNPVTGESLGGGNSKEVITGTADTILSTYTQDDYNDIVDEMLAGNISINATIDLAALGGTVYKCPVAPIHDNANKGELHCYYCVPQNDSGMDFYWYYDGVASVPKLRSLVSGTSTDVTSHASQINITFDIYHHPMP